MYNIKKLLVLILMIILLILFYKCVEEFCDTKKCKDNNECSEGLTCKDNCCK